MNKSGFLKNLKSLLVSTAMLGLTVFSPAMAEDNDVTRLPLANTAIGNQASLTYETLGGQSKYLQSNIVITTINQMFAVSLQPDRTVTVYNTKTATLNHVLMNTGNGTDSYTLSTTYDAGRGVKIYLDTNNNGVLDTGEGEVPLVGGVYTVSNLPAWSTVGLIVSVPTVAGDFPGPLTGTITATSVGDNTKTSAANETIKFTQNAQVSVYKALSVSKYPSDIDRVITVYLKLYNDTGTDKTPGTDATDINLTDTLNTNFHYVSNSATWQPIGSTTATPISDNYNQGGVTYKFTNRSGDEGTDSIKFTLDTVAAGTTLKGDGGVLSFQVLIPAKTPMQAITNQAIYSFNNGLGDVPDNKSNTVTYDVLKYVQAKFTGASIDSAQAGQTVRFVNRFTNTANAPEIYDLSLNNQFFPSGTTFRMALQSVGSDDTLGNEIVIMDTNGSGSPDTGIVGIGQTVNVILYANLPENIPNPQSNYTVTKVATSTYTPTYNVRANDTLKTVTSPTVDLTNNYSLIDNPNAPGKGLGPELSPVTQISLNPGSTGTFTLFVNNTSSYITDTFKLEVSTKPDFSDKVLPAGVVVNFKDGTGALITSTTSIAPLANQRVNAEVSIDYNTLATTVPLYFRVTSATTGAKDIKYDSVIINAVRNVAITSDTSGTIYAGGNIVYTHKVQNNGNVLEGDGVASDINIVTKDSLPQWTTLIYLDTNRNGIFDINVDIPFRDFASIGGLNPGQSVTIFASVSAPIGAVAGSSDVTTITPNVSQGTYSVAPIITYATDTTTVLAEVLSITKKQKAGKGNIYTIAPQESNPGGIICYMIEVTNTGSIDADKVTIQDTIPAFTKYFTDATTKAASYTILNPDGTEGAFIPAQTVPQSGGTGEIIAQIGTLAPNQTARLYFNVKINNIPAVPSYDE